MQINFHSLQLNLSKKSSQIRIRNKNNKEFANQFAIMNEKSVQVKIIQCQKNIFFK